MCVLAVPAMQLYIPEQGEAEALGERYSGFVVSQDSSVLWILPPEKIMSPCKCVTWAREWHSTSPKDKNALKFMLKFYCSFFHDRFLEVKQIF